MKKPQLIIEDYQYQNPDGVAHDESWQDLSTILVMPCYSTGVHPLVVQNWMNIMAPMNQKFTRIFVTDMEVGAAYSWAVDQILAHPELSKWKFMATLEHDNIVQPDWLLKIYPDMNDYDVIGSLYHTKGELGKPMCYGNPKHFPLNFIPFTPVPNAVTECNGLGMGANVFRIGMFKNPNLKRPFFQTVQKYTPGIGAEAYTQDLKFFENAGKLGYKFGCTTKTLTGHMDLATGRIW